MSHLISQFHMLGQIESEYLPITTSTANEQKTILHTHTFMHTSIKRPFGGQNDANGRSPLV